MVSIVTQFTLHVCPQRELEGRDYTMGAVEQLLSNCCLGALFGLFSEAHKGDRHQASSESRWNLWSVGKMQLESRNEGFG